ncbi:MAG: porphobilinogen synthase [bacterium]|nr:porphobilinogen synthase [bacterium]
MFKRYRYRRVNTETRMRYRETLISKADLIWPVFLVEGNNIKKEISGMPGVFHYSADFLIPDLKELYFQGLTSIILFPVPDKKDLEYAYHSQGILQKAIPKIKEHLPGLEIITDVCLCSFTVNGHCHIGDNDKTCEILADIALSHARAGADIVAPSDMMDGRIFYIREKLNKNKFKKTEILSYAAKYASSFYGPFRKAAKSTPGSGDRKTYQMDYANSEEAMMEISSDIEEGAGQIIIKPALSYLDIINKARTLFKIPVVAYNVSGEYCMIRNAVENKLCNEDIILEILIAMKRAGASRIISYFVPYLFYKQLLM